MGKQYHFFISKEKPAWLAMKLTDVLKIPKGLLQNTLAYVSKSNKQ
jgi:hypothetical protein